MGEITNIGWCRHTWSPWTGCTRVSPACDGCYAANLMANRFGRVIWGERGAGEGTRTLMSESYWRLPYKWDRAAKLAGTRPFVFPSLCDPFDTAVPRPWFKAFVQIMTDTPHLVWLLLTKRPGNIVRMTRDLPLPKNVALGCTVINQEEWDRDIPKLGFAANVREPLFTFTSIEPLLAPIRFRPDEWSPDWIITGGETDQGAHKARPWNPEWASDIEHDAHAAGKLFFHKQNGEWQPHTYFGDSIRDVLLDGKQVQSHDFGGGVCAMKVGRTRSGRMLNHRTWDERPEVPAL